MSTLDVQRATAIISRGQEHGYFPEGKMPESETDRIVEAEKLVVLAQQVEVLAKEIGKHNIPGWPAAEVILFEAQVTMGSGESNGHAASVEETAKEDESDVKATQDSSASTDVHVDQPQQQAAVEVSASQAAGRQASVEAGDWSRSPDPQKGEVWADAQGEEWEVLSYGGGPSAEVMKVSTGEKTLVPAGMLKTKVRNAPGEFQHPISAPSDETSDTSTTNLVEDALQELSDQGLATGPDGESYKVSFTGKAPEQAYTSPDTSIPEHDDEDDERYQSILAETEERYTPAGWVIPHELQEPPDLMPEMLDQVPDVMAQRYHSQFNAAAARAKYLHDVEDARARGCKLTRKLFLRGAMRKAREQLGGSSTITEREAWAEDFDDDVRVWGERANKHDENARAWKTFFDLYTQNVVVLSRDWTMRDQQEKS